MAEYGYLIFRERRCRCSNKRYRVFNLVEALAENEWFCQRFVGGVY
jgi:hypothetical protein